VVVNSTQPASEDRIIDVVSWILNIPNNRINPHTDLIDDLYLDALERDLLIARLERVFGIVLSTEEVASIDTIQDAQRCFQRHAA